MSDQPGHVMIIGATSGVGLALTRRLSPYRKVTAVGRRQDRLERLKQEGVETLAADISKLDGIPGVVQQAVAGSGPLTALVFCAGMQKIKPMRSLTAADIEELYRLNLMAPTMLAAQFASRRVTAEDAVFCLVSSIAATRAEPGIVAYGASKAGAEALIRGLAREIGPRRAVGVVPGWLDTEMTQSYPHLYNEAFRERLAKESPAGPASVDAVVDCVEFLLSPQAKYITGEIIRVDGGAGI